MIVIRDDCQQFLPSLFTQITPAIKQWSSYPLPLSLDWPGNLLWPKECSRNNTVPVPILGLKRIVASTLTPLESSCQVKMFGLDNLLVTWRKGGPASHQPFDQPLWRHYSCEWRHFGCSSLCWVPNWMQHSSTPKRCHKRNGQLSPANP